MRISDGSSDVCSSDLHAVRQAMPDVPDEAQVLVLYGDVPLITTATLQRLLAADGRIAVLVADLEDPTGYGRIVRDPEGRVGAIVEHKDATEEPRHIRTINTGILAADAVALKGWRPRHNRKCAGEGRSGAGRVNPGGR